MDIGGGGHPFCQTRRVCAPHRVQARFNTATEAGHFQAMAPRRTPPHTRRQTLLMRTPPREPDTTAFSSQRSSSLQLSVYHVRPSEVRHTLLPVIERAIRRRATGRGLVLTTRWTSTEMQARPRAIDRGRHSLLSAAAAAADSRGLDGSSTRRRSRSVGAREPVYQTPSTVSPARSMGKPRGRRQKIKPRGGWIAADSMQSCGREYCAKELTPTRQAAASCAARASLSHEVSTQHTLVHGSEFVAHERVMATRD
jgi:hypothetical protein